MAGVYVKDTGTWKLPKSIWINQLGTWRVCSNVYVKSGGTWREMMKTVTITGSQTNFNLHNYVGSPSQPLNLIVTIPANVTITSYDVLPKQGYQNRYDKRYNIAPRTTAFTVGAFASGSTVIINNNGYISGGGGFGGAGGYTQERGPQNTTAGAKGGDASYGIVKGGSGYTCTIVNTGTIAGGGGGGGGGGADARSTGSALGGQGGDGAGITGYAPNQGQAGQRGQAGTFLVIGGQDYVAYGGDAGAGGSNGKNGVGGAAATGGYPNTSSSGGVGRPAIASSGIEIAVSGTILGGIG